jgi:hypothetical protein
MTHNLVKRSSKDYYCTKCGQQWTGPSKAHCPNLKVFKYNEFGTLMTKTQLGQAGYKNTPKALPAPTGCYRRTMDGRDNEYVKLYDPALCEKKPPSKRPRKQTGLLSKVLVPASLIPLIDDYRETSQIRENTKNFNSDIFNHWTQSAVELANEIQEAQLMPDEELARANAITLLITPSRFFGNVYETRNPSDAHMISRRVVSAYQRYMDAQKVQS